MSPGLILERTSLSTFLSVVISCWGYTVSSRHMDKGWGWGKSWHSLATVEENNRI